MLTKVRELIEALGQHDPEAVVVFYTARHETVDEVGVCGFRPRHQWFDCLRPNEAVEVRSVALEAKV